MSSSLWIKNTVLSNLFVSKNQQFLGLLYITIFYLFDSGDDLSQKTTYNQARINMIHFTLYYS